MHTVFPKEELNQRLLNVRSQMAHANVDGIVITVPENTQKKKIIRANTRMIIMAVSFYRIFLIYVLKNTQPIVELLLKKFAHTYKSC